MRLQNITEEVFTSFTKNHPNGTFLQTIEQKKLKEIYGNATHLVGLFQDNEIIGATLLIDIPAKFKKRIFYAPRGFLTDYTKPEYVKAFTEELKKYVKEHHGLELIIDPYIIYQLRDTNGKESEHKNDEIIQLLKDLGYRHFGFNLNFEASQVRFMYRIKVLPTYDEMLRTFTKSTRKHLEEIPNKGVKVRVATFDDLELVTKLLQASAINKHFEYRSLSYYQNLYRTMKDLLKIYIAYIDLPYYQNNVHRLLKEEEKKLEQVEFEMSKVNVGAKLLTRKETAEKHIEKYKKEWEHINTLKETYGDFIDIGTLISIRSNNEYITLSSGMLPEFRDFNPKYAMYDAHMKDAIKENFQYVNFYGISGNFDPKNELYGIYDLKRGFNGEVVELIGEFSLPTSSLYSFYHFLLNIKKLFKK